MLAQGPKGKALTIVLQTSTLAPAAGNAPVWGLRVKPSASVFSILGLVEHLDFVVCCRLSSILDLDFR